MLENDNIPADFSSEVFLRVKIGSQYLGNGRCDFSLWAPLAGKTALRIISPEERTLPLARDDNGYWFCRTENVYPGTLYFFVLDTEIVKPDPATYSQPAGVHGPSEVLDHAAFTWTDTHWQGIEPEDLVLYELHIGTFTKGGTFGEAIGRLDVLRELGINGVQVMPVAQFPGTRNWGYDGVHPYAVQNSYGGPSGLKTFVDACHERGIAVVLDVVYNHLGPEGNYIGLFGPYFTDKYRTLWGEAVNFDGPYSDEVRAYFIGNALHWFGHYHVDGLRLDAVHSIFDMSAKPFLAELAECTAEFSRKDGRRHFLIAESNLNDVRILKSIEEGGWGLDAQWNDDFHHSLHALLTADRNGYYDDFGSVEDFRKAWKEAFVYTWKYSRYRKRHHGSPVADRPERQFVVYAQNHDQVGNRMLGDRLATHIPFEALKLAAGAVILSPYIPMLFMGEEYGEAAPFLYFVSHSDQELVRAVSAGRKKEFSSFRWEGEPPDPQDENTFLRSKLDWEQRTAGNHRVLLEFYRKLIGLRKENRAVNDTEREVTESVDMPSGAKLCAFPMKSRTKRMLYLLNFDQVPHVIGILHGPERLKKILDSSETQWGGPGALLPENTARGVAITINPYTFAVFETDIPV